MARGETIIILLKEVAARVELPSMDDYKGSRPDVGQPWAGGIRMARRRASNAAWLFTSVFLAGLPFPMMWWLAGPAVTPHALWRAVLWLWLAMVLMTGLRSKFAASACKRSEVEAGVNSSTVAMSPRRRRVAACWLVLVLVWGLGISFTVASAYGAEQIARPQAASAVTVDVTHCGRRCVDPVVVTFFEPGGRLVTAQALAPFLGEYGPGGALIFDGGNPDHVMFASDYAFAIGSARTLALVSTAVLLIVSPLMWWLYRQPGAGDTRPP